MRGKKGAVNWTIGKLINIVLLTLVLVLIIYGLTTGGLNPLIKNIEGKFNEVLVMFNIKDGVSSEECYSAPVASLSGGEVFLAGVGLEGKDVDMNICRNRECNFTGELSEYRNSEGLFEGREGEVWSRDHSVFLINLGDVRFEWDLYNGVYGFLKDAEGVGFLMNPVSTKKFVLSGDNSGTAGAIVAIWQNNVWVIEREGIGPVAERDDNEAIDFFSKIVRGLTDAEVSYDDGMGNSGEIGELVGNEGWFSSSNELDDDKEVARLKVEFAKKKAKYIEDTSLKPGQIENLTEAVSGKVITVAGKEFSMEVKKVGGELVIMLVSGDLRFGMKYFLDGEYGDFWIKCDRSSFPFVLVEWDGSWKEKGAKGYYKLEEECFEKIYQKSLVADFLSVKCR